MPPKQAKIVAPFPEKGELGAAAVGRSLRLPLNLSKDGAGLTSPVGVIVTGFDEVKGSKKTRFSVRGCTSDDSGTIHSLKILGLLTGNETDMKFEGTLNFATEEGCLEFIQDEQ